LAQWKIPPVIVIAFMLSLGAVIWHTFSDEPEPEPDLSPVKTGSEEPTDEWSGLDLPPCPEGKICTERPYDGCELLLVEGFRPAYACKGW
jgi:hypothetical protein